MSTLLDRLATELAMVDRLDLGGAGFKMAHVCSRIGVLSFDQKKFGTYLYCCLADKWFQFLSLAAQGRYSNPGDWYWSFKQSSRTKIGRAITAVGIEDQLSEVNERLTAFKNSVDGTLVAISTISQPLEFPPRELVPEHGTVGQCHNLALLRTPAFMELYRQVSSPTIPMRIFETCFGLNIYQEMKP